MIDRNFQTPFSLGRYKFKNGDYLSAINTFKTGMENGDIKCRFGYANMLYFGYKINGQNFFNKNAAKRMMMLIYEPILKLANNDDPEASFIIGMYFINGYYSVGSREHALKWFIKSHELGYFEAQDLIYAISMIWKNPGPYTSIYDDKFSSDKNELINLLDEYKSLSSSQETILSNSSRINKIETRFLCLFSKINTYIEMSLESDLNVSTYLQDSHKDIISLNKTFSRYMELVKRSIKLPQEYTSIKANLEIKREFDKVFDDYNSYFNESLVDSLKSYSFDNKGILSNYSYHCYVASTVNKMLSEKTLFNSYLTTLGYSNSGDYTIEKIGINKTIFDLFKKSTDEVLSSLSIYTTFKANQLYKNNKKPLFEKHFDCLLSPLELDYSSFDFPLLSFDDSHIFYSEIFDALGDCLNFYFKDGKEFVEYAIKNHRIHKIIDKTRSSKNYYFTDPSDFYIFYNGFSTLKGISKLSELVMEAYCFMFLDKNHHVSHTRLENNLFIKSLCKAFSAHVINYFIEQFPHRTIYKEEKVIIFGQHLIKDILYSNVENTTEIRGKYLLINESALTNSIIPQEITKVTNYSVDASSYCYTHLILDKDYFNKDPYPTILDSMSILLGNEIEICLENTSCTKDKLLETLQLSLENDAVTVFNNISFDISSKVLWSRCYNNIVNFFNDFILSSSKNSK